LMTLLFLASFFSVTLEVQRVEANGTIYIRAEGSIDPPDAPISTVDNVTYTLTGNIASSADGIVIERDNMILDGAGYTVQGTDRSYDSRGIDLTGRSNVTIKYMNIEAFDSGVYLHSSSNDDVRGSNVTDNNKGIFLDSYSSNDNLSGNSVAGNFEGIQLGYSSWNNVSRNNITGNDDFGIRLDVSSNNSIGENMFFNNGLFVDDSFENVVVDNLVNSKPLVYLESVSDYAVEEAGQVILVNCNRITVKSLNLSNTAVGVELFQTNNTKITRNSIKANHRQGITLWDSSCNNIGENNITANNMYGIVLGSSHNNSINGNNITANKWDDIYLSYSSSNIISGNNINSISFWYSSYNGISGNNVANNEGGIYFEDSSNNNIYHNNLMNAGQVYSNGSVNVWDDGYPLGGNYWSDHRGTDLHSGLNQNETGSDGISDAAYAIDSNNNDHYPLMGMFNSYDVTYFTMPLASHACNVTVISNSTISDFVAPIWIEHPEVIMLMFNITGEQGTTGFCRVSFPTAMMNSTYHVSVNGTEVPYALLPCSSADYGYLYFTYAHSEEEVVITPEFPSFLLLSLFMITTLPAVAVHRRKIKVSDAM
jgi:parallel beta-helix repeat protein